MARLRAVYEALATFIKVNIVFKLTHLAPALDHQVNGVARNFAIFSKPAGIIMSRVIAAAFATALVAIVAPTAASAGCYSCYQPQPCCGQQYVQQVVPAEYRTVQETVMVSPGRTIAHRTPARYQTVMVPQTVMVEPEGVAYEQIPPQFANVQRTEMVAPARAYFVQSRPRCSNCGW